VPECSAASRCAAVMAAHLPLRLPAVSPETALDSAALHRRAAALKSAARRQVGSALRKVVVLHPPAVPTAAALELAPLQAGRAAPKVLVLHRASAREPARSSAEFAARDAAAILQQEVAASDVTEGAQEVAALGEAEAPRLAVASVGVALLPEAVPQQEAWDAAAVPLPGAVLRAVPDVPVAEPRAARPSAVPWVFRRDQALPWPAPQPAVRFARAMQCLQIALPSALSWQAVRDEVLSWWLESPQKICNKPWRSTNKVRPDCGGLEKRNCFYSGYRRSQCVPVHGAFRRSFATVLSHCPRRHIRRARIQIGLRARQVADPAIGRSRRGRRLRSAHRQFIRPVARQLVRPRRLAGIPHRRRHLRPWTSRRAFLRRLRRLSRLDRWILLGIDRRFAHPEQRRGDADVPLALSVHQ
jgi:hypothetical protein